MLGIGAFRRPKSIAGVFNSELAGDWSSPREGLLQNMRSMTSGLGADSARLPKCRIHDPLDVHDRAAAVLLQCSGTTRGRADRLIDRDRHIEMIDDSVAIQIARVTGRYRYGA